MCKTPTQNGHARQKICLAASRQGLMLAAMDDPGADPAARAHEVTSLLQEWSGGDPDAEARVFALVYDELRQLAARYLSQERARPHAPAHRARPRGLPAAGGFAPGHFLAEPRALFRHRRADHAAPPRPARPHPRDGTSVERTCATGCRWTRPRSPWRTARTGLVALDGAMERSRARVSAPVGGRRTQVLRRAGGAGNRRRVLQVSEKTVLRDWNFARLWLYRELGATIPRPCLKTASLRGPTGCWRS